MAESNPYLLPNTQGRYVTQSVTNQSGSVYRIDGTRTIYADYSVVNGKTILDASTFSSAEFQRNLAQNSQGYNQTISNSILQVNGQTNSQPNPNQQGTPGSSIPTSGPNKQPASPGGTLVYPNDLASTDQDRIMFHAHEYKSGINTRIPSLTGEFKLDPIQYIPIEQRVFLPIQASITDQNAVGWEPDTLNPIQIEAARFSKNLMTNPLEDWGNIAATQFGAALNLLKQGPLQDAVRTYIIGQAIGVNNLQSRLNGQVLNPNLELLFQGPQLRPFSFTFKLSPRTDKEAETVKAIIKYFKKNMAVKKDNAIFLKAPNVFKIQYQYGKNKSQAHPGLNLIKMCALTNCSVDYTPLGTYMTYPEGTMISYSISLSFQELTPIYEDDYDTFNYGDRSTVPNPIIGP
jgi:hypothetical protein